MSWNKKKAAYLPPSLCHLLIGKMYSLDNFPTNGRKSTWMSAPCKRPTYDSAHHLSVIPIIKRDDKLVWSYVEPYCALLLFT